jgi:tetratricopeptide (TPR) repeat protein
MLALAESPHSLAEDAMPRSALFLVLITLAASTPLRAADDESAAKALVAAAGKACEALAKEQPRAPETKQAWLNLAQARVNMGDVAGSIAALDHVNKDHDYSVASAWVMETEALGKTMPDPAGVEDQVLALHRVGAIRGLIAAADYPAAISQAKLMPEGEARRLSLARCYIEIAQAHAREERYTAALESYKEAMEIVTEIRSAKSGVPCLLEIAEGFIDCALELAAAPLLTKTEEAIGKLPDSQQNATSMKWLQQAALLRLRMKDEAAAKKDFAAARALYEKVGAPRTGVAWEKTPLAASEFESRWEAYWKLKNEDAAGKLLKDWSATIANVDPQLISANATASLLEAQLLSGDEPGARKVLDALGPVDRSLALMQIRRHSESRESKSVNLAMAAYLVEQFREGDEKPLRPGALTLACECYGKAGERAKFKACLQEALEISEANGKENHAALAALLVEMDEQEEANKLLATLTEAQRALAVSEQALNATRKLCQAKLAPEIARRKEKLSLWRRTRYSEFGLLYAHHKEGVGTLRRADKSI